MEHDGCCDYCGDSDMKLYLLPRGHSVCIFCWTDYMWEEANTDNEAVEFDLCDHCDSPDTDLTLYLSEAHHGCWLCTHCLDYMLMDYEEMEATTKVSRDPHISAAVCAALEEAIDAFERGVVSIEHFDASKHKELGEE